VSLCKPEAAQDAQHDDGCSVTVTSWLRGVPVHGYQTYDTISICQRSAHAATACPYALAIFCIINIINDYLEADPSAIAAANERAALRVDAGDDHLRLGRGTGQG
jgi:hypothetical protein